MRIISAAILALLATSGVATAATDPAVKCAATQLKIASKYAACVLKADATAESKGEDPDYAKCNTQYTDKWGAAETKAGMGICPGDGDDVAVKALLDNALERASALTRGWSCSINFFDDGDCDCGCGISDHITDCVNATVAECDFCNNPGSCSMAVCPGTIDPVDNSQCVMP